MKLKSVLLAMLITALVAFQPPRLAAQAVGDAETEGFDSSKFWDYAMCGASIVLAAGTGGWVIAVLVCGKAATEHWTK